MTAVSIKGPEEFKAFYDRMRARFSGIRLTCNRVIAEGDRVCACLSVRMRHLSHGLGMEATGKAVRTTGISLVRSEKAGPLRGSLAELRHVGRRAADSRSKAIRFFMGAT